VAAKHHDDGALAARGGGDRVDDGSEVTRDQNVRKCVEEGRE
jgi:hypothetical protein